MKGKDLDQQVKTLVDETTPVEKTWGPTRNPRREGNRTAEVVDGTVDEGSPTDVEGDGVPRTREDNGDRGRATGLGGRSRSPLSGTGSVKDSGRRGSGKRHRRH